MTVSKTIKKITNNFRSSDPDFIAESEQSDNTNSALQDVRQRLTTRRSGTSDIKDRRE
eukprot:CAMPEP_0116555822 /NCGR_PEP_ID=MMETSP0397-20121206/8357_1 /TAXON_ID=216820 /ORGANISM="Cyclophora tenuis, Strain ECT3854" /LENGTH=57 /DNA_ID=CAMNT_0004081129 /DNA_START=147 /DNA_END=320 /DNA_ORIENTATION=-